MAILDNFDRANEDPLTTGSWSASPIFPNSFGFRVSGSFCKPKAFQPSDIPNMVLYVDGQVLSSLFQNTGGTTPVTADGQRVARWNDLSGSTNNLTQATAEAQAYYKVNGINGRPAVNFAPGAEEWNYLDSPDFLDSRFNTAFSAFFIGTQSGSDERDAFDCNNNRMGIAEQIGGTGMTYTNRFFVSQLTYDASYINMAAQKIVSNNNIRCVGVSYGGTSVSMIINGYLATYPATGNLALTGGVMVGNLNTPADQNWKGNIGSLYVYRQACSASTMRLMCHYLLDSYGLTFPWANINICYIGDSLTDGGPAPSVVCYPKQMADDIGWSLYCHNNLSQGGADIASLQGYLATRWNGYVDKNCSKNIAVIWAGSNNICQDAQTTQEVVDDYHSLCDACRASGWDTIIVATMLPRSAAGDAADTETRRQSFNTLLRAQYTGFADALVDLAANTTIGDAGDELDTNYYYTDRVHLITAGLTVVKDIIKPVLKTFL